MTAPSGPGLGGGGGGGGGMTQVGTDQDWKQAELWGNSGLALKTNGSLWAWGDNNRGQLGLGHTTNQTTPVQVGTDTDWGLLELGISYSSISMALKTNGSLWFWGEDRYYQSGLRDPLPYRGYLSTPTQVGDGTYDWKVVSLGCTHTLAVKTDGTLWGWGTGYSGKNPLGHGARDRQTTPFQLGTDRNWKTASAGFDFSLGLKNDGTIWSWGSDNYYGQLGNGRMDRDYHPIATQIGTDRDWKMVMAAWNQVGYAIKNDGSLWGWGGDHFSGIGDGTTTGRLVPTRIGESNDWVHISSASHYHKTAIKSDGSVWFWGRNTRNLSTRDPEYFSPHFTRLYNPAFITGLALHGDAETLPPTDQWHYFEKDCRLICWVLQTNNWRVGSPEVLNSLTARVWVDDRTANHHVKRHYQITPTLEATTTTGRVSLYFTQEEFDEFNRVATNLKKLPTGPDDAAGKANLLVERRGGVSADGSGRPASYSGAAETINPEDADIIWDAGNRRWEVKFNVTGFSGFWVKTTDRPLPVIFGSIAARLQGGSLWVDFTSEKETNNHHYEIEASTDGKTFKKIGELCSQAPDGNSDTPLSYTFKTAVSGIMGAAGIAGIVLLALAVGIGSTDPRRRRLLPVAIVAISLCVAAACVKHSREPVAHPSPKIWVRIAQVDKDGTKEYSKIVQAVAKD